MLSLGRVKARKLFPERKFSFPNGSFLYTSVYLGKSFNFPIPIKGIKFPRGREMLSLGRVRARKLFPERNFCHPPSADSNFPLGKSFATRLWREETLPQSPFWGNFSQMIIHLNASLFTPAYDTKCRVAKFKP